MIYALVDSITPFEDKPYAFTKKKYSDDEKKRVLDYMKSKEPDTALGLIWDCVEGKEIRQENVGFEDGEFMWSSQDMYHIEKYDAAVRDDFLKKVSEK